MYILTLLILLIFISILIILIGLIVRLLLFLREKKIQKNVCIVVLGDIGRSPRMQYHALSFIKEGFTVDIIGYPGSSPLKQLTSNPNVNILYLKQIPEWNENVPRLLSYIIKTLWQSINLLFLLLIKIDCKYLMIQNPPAIPTIPICWFFCLISQTKFIIDWHNYAFTIMSLALGKQHLLVRVSKLIEFFFGSKADQHFCVSNAMKEDLSKNWNIKAEVLYDRPSDKFKPIDLIEKHSLLMKLGKIYPEFDTGDKNSSILTECIESTGEIRLKENRPALIISSTSWTEDEDFSILFTALKQYELTCDKSIDLPDLICAITGKGPLKDFWNAIIKKKNWKHVKIVTPWLENEDYPKLLACADLGICLHTSSSGLDLPMKVIDMFGCGLPVCAYNFQCLNELVKHEVNSLIFSNDTELFEQLVMWFTNYPNNNKQIEMNKKFREELMSFQNVRWDGNWKSIVLDTCF